jgi:hypothetical protein
MGIAFRQIFPNSFLLVTRHLSLVTRHSSRITFQLFSGKIHSLLPGKVVIKPGDCLDSFKEIPDREILIW